MDLDYTYLDTQTELDRVLTELSNQSKSQRDRKAVDQVEAERAATAGLEGEVYIRQHALGKNEQSEMSSRGEQTKEEGFKCPDTPKGRKEEKDDPAAPNVQSLKEIGNGAGEKVIKENDKNTLKIKSTTGRVQRKAQEGMYLVAGTYYDIAKGHNKPEYFLC